MNKAAKAIELAPVAPPCFSARDQWLEYVGAAATAGRDGHLPGPLLIEAGQPVRFNPKFDVCSDCDDRHAAQMGRQGKCKPRYLIELFAAQPAKEVRLTTERRNYVFHTHEGHELTAELSGEPGRRVVALRNHKGQDIGALAYAELVGESCRDTFCVGGDVTTCREEDLIVIDRGRLRTLAEWAESAAIGPMAIGEEVHE